MCVCVHVSCAAGLEEEAALIALDSTDSSTRMSPHTHTHTHIYTKIRTHATYMYIPIHTIHAYTPAHSQPANYLHLIDTHGHTVTHIQLQPQWLPPKPSQIGMPSSALFETHYFTLSHRVPHRNKSTNTPSTTQPNTYTHTHTAPVNYTKSHPDTQSCARQALRLHNLPWSAAANPLGTPCCLLAHPHG